ncbi:MAG: SPOR domain-containing protein [Candidatus Firestonebacteria bacterium]|nr:SPOR domain-containing protein [Candidatus Firestonebacteria bacterium]
MVVPGKNLSENVSEKDNKSSKKKIWIYTGIGVGVVILLIGIFLLFKFVIFNPSVEEDTAENEIDKILSSIKKDESNTTNIYGGLTEAEIKLKKKFEKNEEPEIDKELVLKSKDVKKEESLPGITEEKTPPPQKKEEKKEVKKTTEENAVQKKIDIEKVATETTQKKQEPKSAPKEVSDYKFTIQIASFKSTINAEKDKKKLEERGFETELKSADLGAKGTWYRLRVGKFKTTEEAKTELWKVKSIGYSNAIVTAY